MDQEQICAELDRVGNDYRDLLDTATVAELRQPTEGTKWNNEQLLFHMLFGYLLVRNLRILVKGFSRLPDAASRRFAALLNAGTRPFHVLNYVGSLFGARVLGYARMVRLMDRILSSLQSSVRREPDTALDRGMHFPVGWDPYFRDYMTLRDVYHYPTQHYDHHRRQLTLAKARGGRPQGLDLSEQNIAHAKAPTARREEREAVPLSRGAPATDETRNRSVVPAPRRQPTRATDRLETTRSLPPALDQLAFARVLGSSGLDISAAVCLEGFRYRPPVVAP